MNVLVLSFYFPPDLCAGSFRAQALVEAMKVHPERRGKLSVITTHPNRYSSYRVQAQSFETDDGVEIHRIKIPDHQSGMLSQSISFIVYMKKVFGLMRKVKPDYVVCTTGRSMSGLMTLLFSRFFGYSYYIDVRDIFSESISDVFERKSKLLSRFFKFVFSRFEKAVLNNATGVNVVSAGFLSYFQEIGLDVSHWTCHTNGIDRQFIGIPATQVREPKRRRILYAGNIGAGQGLEKIIPQLASRLDDGFEIEILGDGGAKSGLLKRIEELSLHNVHVHDPVGRDELKDHYANADILFLHLNDLAAFKRVLPSKLFEYVAMRKPIVAGISGYSASFLTEGVSHAFVFDPGDVDAAAQCVDQAARAVIEDDEIDEFMNKFNRQSIMMRMAGDVYEQTSVSCS